MKIWYSTNPKHRPPNMDYIWIQSYEELINRFPRMLIPIHEENQIVLDFKFYEKYYDISEVVFCPSICSNYIMALDYIRMNINAVIIYKTRNPFILWKIKKHINKVNM